MSETVRIDTSEYSSKGNVNIGGLNLDINSFIGEEICRKFFMQIKDEQLQAIFDYMSKEIWVNFSGETRLKMKETGPCYDRKTEGPMVAEYAKNLLNDQLKEIIVAKVDEYCKSEEYKEKAEKIAKEIVDYAIEGYKNDMIAALRNKLVLDPLDTTYKEKQENELTCKITTLVYDILESYRSMNN